MARAEEGVVNITIVKRKKVVAADGHRHFAEMEQFDRAMQAVNISPEIIHKAFDQYFAETMPGS